MTAKKRISVLFAGLLCLLLCAGTSCTQTDDGDATASQTQETMAEDTADTTDAQTDTVAGTTTDTTADTETEAELPPLVYTDFEFCHYNYECVRSVNEVVADGVYHAQEWAEAKELVINKNTLAEWGRWQTGPALEPEDLSVTLKLKWDEDYLYILEIRTDSKYVYQFGQKGYDAFSDVWGGDATALFFCDAADISRSNRCDIGYFTYVDKLDGPSVYVGSFDGEMYAYRGPSGTEGCTYGGTLEDDTAYFEMKLPWSIIADQGKLLSDIEEGTLFRFSPVIPSVDSQEGLGAYGKDWRQINFHDCVDNGEGGDPDDPMYWAALTLVGTDAGD